MSYINCILTKRSQKNVIKTYIRKKTTSIILYVISSIGSNSLETWASSEKSSSFFSLLLVLVATSHRSSTVYPSPARCFSSRSSRLSLRIQMMFFTTASSQFELAQRQRLNSPLKMFSGHLNRRLMENIFEKSLITSLSSMSSKQASKQYSIRFSSFIIRHTSCCFCEG